MSDDERDGAAVWIPPPLVYPAAIVLGVLLQLVLPLPLGLSTALRIGGAAACLLLGLPLGATAFRLFRRTGQDPKPWKPTPEILSSGAYRFTRNPMYVGMGLVQAAAGIGLANGWILALLPVSLGVVYLTAIRHEEVYLERKFGETYLAYKRSVRRWI